MNDIQPILNNIFNIIGYKGDREQLYSQLLGICYLRAVDQLIESLPEDKRVVVRKEISSVSDPKQIQEMVNKHFNQQQFNDALQKSSESIFKEYIETIKGSLSDSQIIQLKEYITSLNSQANPST